MSLSLVEKENSTDGKSEDENSFSLSSLSTVRERRLNVRRFSVQQEESSPEELLGWAIAKWGKGLALVTSFQADGLVLLDMALSIDPELRVITLDTGRLPAETYLLMERVRERYGVAIEVFSPDADAVQEMVRDAGPNLFYQSLEARQRCCQVRKVEPLQRALASSDAWITGLRRDQSPSRAKIGKVEIDSRNSGKIKLSPLASWNSQQVWDYIHQHRLPYHSLYDRGYTSIGCSPCTRPTVAGESARAGRWWWEKGGGSECGLHVQQAQEGSPQVSIDLLRQSARTTAAAARS